MNAATEGTRNAAAVVVDRLIATKRTQETGSAFRPAREADMMRRLVERHRGILPLDTAEGIWRVIISTFTYVQAPYSVHADLTPGDAAMRDTARFHFGFTAPLVPHMGAGGVVAAVSASKGDVGLVPAIGWVTACRPSTRTSISGEEPTMERSPMRMKNMYGDGLTCRSARYTVKASTPTRASKRCESTTW